MAEYSLKSIFANDPTGYANYKAGQKSGQYSDYSGYLAQGGGSGGSGNSVVQNAIKLQQDAVKPAVESLQATQGPLEERYKNLLASIKGNQTVAENRQTLTTGNELAKRGITNDSGLYQQEQTNAVNPITQQYNSQYTDMGLQGEQSIRDLASQIAQLQYGASSTGISQGIQQSQFNAQQTANAASQKQSSDAAAAQQKLNELIYNTISLPQSQYAVNKPYYNPSTTTTPIDLAALQAEYQKLYGGN